MNIDATVLKNTKLNAQMYKTLLWPSGVYPLGMYGWSSSHKLTNVISHTKRLKKKHHGLYQLVWKCIWKNSKSANDKISNTNIRNVV